MLKRQRKVNIAGSASCISLLLLAFLLVNPLIGGSASALEGEENEVSPQATTISDVNISFSPTSGSASLTPVTEEGVKARTSVKANVSISNSGGYSVYLSSKTPGLIGKNSGEMIAGIDGSSTFDTLQTNTWGYAVTEEEELPENALYKSMSQGQGDLLATGSERSVSYNFLLSFAAKIGNTKPADTYENEVTLSVVSSPLEVSNVFGIETMQEMTSKICESVPTPTAFTETGEINADVPTAQLIDSRDGKSYWVAKLADGNCWMTQNLALDLDRETLPLNSASSDVSVGAGAGYSPTHYTTSENFTENANTNQNYDFSWTQKGYVDNVPTDTYTYCRDNEGTSGLLNGLSGCAGENIISVGERKPSANPNFFYVTSYAGMDGSTNCSKPANSALSEAATGPCAQYDAHYYFGNWYQWGAATAGTGTSLQSSADSNADAAGSICPAGWKLPHSQGGGSSYTPPFAIDSYGALLQAYGWEKQGNITSYQLVEKPFYFLRGGGFNYGTIGYLWGAAAPGLYWTSTASISNEQAMGFVFGDTNDVQPVTARYKYLGLAVRCIAR